MAQLPLRHVENIFIIYTTAIVLMCEVRCNDWPAQPAHHCPLILYSYVKTVQKSRIVHRTRLKGQHKFTIAQAWFYVGAGGGQLPPKPEPCPQNLLTAAVCGSKTSKQLYRGRFLEGWSGWFGSFGLCCRYIFFMEEWHSDVMVLCQNYDQLSLDSVLSCSRTCLSHQAV